MEKKDVAALGPCDAIAQNCACCAKGHGGCTILCRGFWELMTLVTFWPVWWVFHAIRIPMVTVVMLLYCVLAIVALLVWIFCLLLLVVIACNWVYVKQQASYLGVVLFYTVALVVWCVYELADHCLMGLLPDPMPWLPEPGFSQRYHYRPDSFSKFMGFYCVGFCCICDKDCARDCTMGDECCCDNKHPEFTEDQRKYPPLPLPLPDKENYHQYLCERKPAGADSWTDVAEHIFEGSIFGILQWFGIFSRYRKHFALQFFWGPCCPLDGPACALCTAGVRRSKWFLRYPSRYGFDGTVWEDRNPYHRMKIGYDDMRSNASRRKRYKPGLNFYLENFTRAQAKPPCACIMPHLNYADVEYGHIQPDNLFGKLDKGVGQNLFGHGEEKWDEGGGGTTAKSVSTDEISLRDLMRSKKKAAKEAAKAEKRAAKEARKALKKKQEPALPDATSLPPSAPDAADVDVEARQSISIAPPPEEMPPEYNSDMDD